MEKLSIYMFIWYVRVPYMHSALFVRDAKLATFESQKEVVCTIHLWNPKKGEKGYKA